MATSSIDTPIIVNTESAKKLIKAMSESSRVIISKSTEVVFSNNSIKNRLVRK